MFKEIYLITESILDYWSSLDLKLANWKILEIVNLHYNNNDLKFCLHCNVFPFYINIF